jgi:hypothetical protein
VSALAATSPAAGSGLPRPFATPPATHGLAPSAATKALVASQVSALLATAPSFHALGAAEQRELIHRMTRIAAYAAECLRDIYWQSAKLGQRPVLKERSTERLQPAVAAAESGPGRTVARTQANDFQPRAADQIARVTQQTLRAIAFPTFVADLIRGTFDAITRTTMQQMEAFVQLLRNVSKTVDQFMDDNVSDEHAHAWLAQTYPRHLTLQGGRAVPRSEADELPPPNFEAELHVQTGLDESSIEETLVPAARRRMAETRLQMLSTLVLMGINRIVITSGKIRATMGFHIDTSDSAFERTAEDVDARIAARGSVNLGFWGLEASTSLAYVSSKRAGSDDEINVETDLTGEVELNFKSDYFPVERFANRQTLQTISGHTAVPEANPPPGAPPAPASAPATYPGFQSSRTQRREREKPPAMTPAGAPLPEPRLPTAPIARGTLDPTMRPPRGGDSAAGGGREKADGGRERADGGRERASGGGARPPVEVSPKRSADGGAGGTASGDAGGTDTAGGGQEEGGDTTAVQAAASGPGAVVKTRSPPRRLPADDQSWSPIL